MQVQQLKEFLVHVTAEEGEDVSSVYRMPNITEIVRFNKDGTKYTHIRATRTPVICQHFDLNFMRVTYRRCHIWFIKQEFKGKTRIACGEFPIPVDEQCFAPEQVNYRVW